MSSRVVVQNYDATPPHFSLSVSATTNRITTSPYAYDNTGNLTNDGNNTLLYDAENHVVSASNGGTSGTYTYDGNGLRVKKVSAGTTTVTIYSAGVDIAEYQNGAAPSSPVNEYVNLGTQKILIFNSGTTTYYHNDHLSLRFRTNSSGTVLDQRGTYPYGETWYSPSGAPWMFTSYFRDTESGNDYAMARSYVSRINRFSSPDPVGGSIADPQSLNAYPYTRNNPVNLVDPTGLFTSGPAPNDPFGGGPFDPWTPWENFGRGSSICTNWGLDDFNLPDIECSDFGPNMHPFGGGVGGGHGGSVNTNALSNCIREKFDVSLISFSPSLPGDIENPGTNGSFTGLAAGVFQGDNKPLGQGPYQFTITNDVSKTTGVLTANYQLNGQTVPPGFEIAGYTDPTDPFTNFTGRNQSSSEVLGTQIWELGNSLSIITKKNVPAQLHVEPGPTNNEAGNLLEKCYDDALKKQ